MEDEMIMKAKSLKAFKDLHLDFVSYNEGNLGVFYRNKKNIPQIIREAFV